jgi:dihydroflavonol-4-reductase
LSAPPLRDDLVFLTGATGFVGSHVLQELLAAGYRVRALVRDPATRIPGCETIAGDLERAGELTPALRDCRYLVHCAALYSFAPRERKAMQRVNVVGTETLLAAAHVAGVERAVVTSSSATVGPARGARPADESDWESHNGVSSYHASKLAQERVALSSRVPAVALLPTTPVGPGDRKPTPTGGMILDFMRGRMIAKPPAGGGLNLVAVEDVAGAHVTALREGRTGERYLIGGENLSLDRIWELLAEITGRPVPRARIPSALLYAIAYADEARCRIDGRARPFVPLEGVRMSSERMYVDCSKAEAQLRYRPRPVRDALERAVAWYRDNGC